MTNLLVGFLLFNTKAVSFGTPSLSDYLMVIFMGLTLWAVILTSLYFILYPLIWQREYETHEVEATLTDKHHKTRTTLVYNAATKTSTPIVSTHYYLTFKPKGKLPYFLSGSYEEDMGSECFNSFSVGTELILTIKEKRRRFRFGSTLNYKYYGFETKTLRLK